MKEQLPSAFQNDTEFIEEITLLHEKIQGQY